MIGVHGSLLDQCLTLLVQILSNAELKTHAPTVRAAASKHGNSKSIKIVFTKPAMPRFLLHVNLYRKSHTM